ncbi:MAG: sortase [bacterium]|nr:sortase [bacterium]
MEQHEVLVYHHLYNKNFGTIEVSVPSDITYTPKAKGSAYTSVIHSLSKIMAVLGLMALILAFGPTLSSFFASDYLGRTAQYAAPLVTTEAKQVDDYIPAFDPTLPMAGRLIIPSIGVKTNIAEATLANYEDALKKGVWRVSDFGSPNMRSMPTIMAAHRFGYLAWTNSYRRLNSFYNLPKAQVGDTVEIDWQGRKYLYEIYSTEKGENITDYSADLILYTCVSLTGSEKDFVYARLLRV